MSVEVCVCVCAGQWARAVKTITEALEEKYDDCSVRL